MGFHSYISAAMNIIAFWVIVRTKLNTTSKSYKVYYMWLSEQKPAKCTFASISKNTILKIQLKKTSFALVVDSLMRIIVLSYLLAFVQLTWQVDNGRFSPFFDNFLNQVRTSRKPVQLVSWNWSCVDRLYVYVCVCACVCPPPRLLITSGVI